MRNIAIVVLLATSLLGGAACSSKPSVIGGTGPTPTTGSSVLAVNLTGQLAGQDAAPIPGMVRIVSPIEATREAGDDGKVTFSDLPDGNYTVAAQRFGYQGRQATVQVAGNGTTNILMPAVLAVRLVEARINGERVESGASVEYPADLAFTLEVMNPGSLPWYLTANMHLEGSNVSTLSPARTGILQTGHQTAGALLRGYQPCSTSSNGAYSTSCVARTNKLVLRFNGVEPAPADSLPFLQVNLDFTLNWQRRTN